MDVRPRAIASLIRGGALRLVLLFPFVSLYPLLNEAVGNLGQFKATNAWAWGDIVGCIDEGRFHPFLRQDAVGVRGLGIDTPARFTPRVLFILPIARFDYLARYG